MGQLKANDKEVVHEGEGNIVVINTCGFIANAKEESVNTILEYVEKKEAKISNIKTKGGHPILQKEAIRIIKKLPRIIPGKQNGKPVIVPFVIPIVFKLPSLSD